MYLIGNCKGLSFTAKNIRNLMNKANKICDKRKDQYDNIKIQKIENQNGCEVITTEFILCRVNEIRPDGIIKRGVWA